MGCSKGEKGRELACEEIEAVARGLKRGTRSAGPLTLRGIALLQAGKLGRAARLFRAAAAENQNDLAAWLWWAATISDPSEQRACLIQALRIDPANPAACFAMQSLGQPVPIYPTQQTPAIYQKVLTTQPMHGRPRGLEQKSAVRPWPLRGPVLMRAAPSLLPVTAGSAMLALGMGTLAGLLSYNHTLVQFWPAFLLLIGMGIAVVLIQFAWRMSVECLLTNRWLVIQTGLLRQRRRLIPLTVLDSVEIRGWRFNRSLTGAGDVLIHIRGASRTLRLRDISSCDLVASRISAAQRLAVRPALTVRKSCHTPVITNQ